MHCHSIVATQSVCCTNKLAQPWKRLFRTESSMPLEGTLINVMFVWIATIYITIKMLPSQMMCFTNLVKLGNNAQNNKAHA